MKLIILAFSALTLAVLPSSKATATDAGAAWWKSGVVYQIYPRSFQDTNGDGVGDLKGITQRLDYLRDLGVDAVWISPFYPSPMKDFGYDVTNFTDVDPRFGTLADFDTLVAEMHKRGLRLVMDFVPNHSSDEHPWFVESRSSKDNPKRDWYMWRDGRSANQPPNNWLSVFSGSAWTYDPTTSQYYYHAFLKEQPDLNWHNPELRAAMLSAMRFWLERGVDGFRIDGISHTMEDAALLDEPADPSYKDTKPEFDKLLHVYTTEQRSNHSIVREMRKLCDQYPGERALITEAYITFEQQAAYYGTPEAPEAQLPFNFHLISADWTAASVAKVVAEYEASLPTHGWPNWVLSNHDKHRLGTRLPQGQARIAAMVLLTLRGTPTLYYADELGMKDVFVPPERAQDPVELKTPGKGFGRDPERAPMLWDATANAGFTTGTPWLPLEPDYVTLNAEAQDSDSQSMLSLYKTLLKLRRATPALNVGSYKQVAANEGVLAFIREAGGQKFFVALNFTNKTSRVTLGDLVGHVACTSVMDQVGQSVAGALELRPNEGVVVRLD